MNALVFRSLFLLLVQCPARETVRQVRLSLGAVSSQARLRGALPDSGERYDVRLMPLGKSDGSLDKDGEGSVSKWK